MFAETPKSPQLLAEAAANAPVYLVVHSNDLPRTNQIVAAFLLNNGIPCQVVPDAAVTNNTSGLNDSLVRRQIVLTPTAQDTLAKHEAAPAYGGAGGGGAGGGGNGSGGVARGQNLGQIQYQASRGNTAQITQAPGAAPTTSNDQVTQQQNPGSNWTNNNQDANSADKRYAAKTVNGPDNIEKSKGVGEHGGGQIETAKEGVSKPAVEDNAPAPSNSPANGYRVIFARMNIRQAQAIERELEDQAAAEQLSLKKDGQGNAAYDVKVNVMTLEPTGSHAASNVPAASQPAMAMDAGPAPATKSAPPMGIMAASTTQPAPALQPSLGVLIVLDAQDQSVQATPPIATPPAAQPQTQPAER